MWPGLRVYNYLKAINKLHVIVTGVCISRHVQTFSAAVVYRRNTNESNLPYQQDSELFNSRSPRVREIAPNLIAIVTTDRVLQPFTVFVKIRNLSHITYNVK